MVKDKEQFKRFLGMIPDLQNDEVYFLSLSARNKYLTAEERAFYELGRTEMFGRTLVKDKKDFDFAMNKLYSNLGFKTTKNGKEIPEKCLVTYMNINPSSMLRAYNMLQTEMSKEVLEINMALLHDNEPNFKGIKLLDRKLMNCIQKSRSRRVFIDIDMDKISTTEQYLFVLELELARITHFTIKTQGGYHVLIKSDTIPKKFNLGELVAQFHNKVKEAGGEVIFNENQMVPVPGTLMRGEHIVTII